jgi:hypothetical protein
MKSIYKIIISIIYGLLIINSSYAIRYNIYLTTPNQESTQSQQIPEILPFLVFRDSGNNYATTIDITGMPDANGNLSKDTIGIDNITLTLDGNISANQALAQWIPPFQEGNSTHPGAIVSLSSRRKLLMRLLNLTIDRSKLPSNAARGILTIYWRNSSRSDQMPPYSTSRRIILEPASDRTNYNLAADREMATLSLNYTQPTIDLQLHPIQTTAALAINVNNNNNNNNAINAPPEVNHTVLAYTDDARLVYVHPQNNANVPTGVYYVTATDSNILPSALGNIIITHLLRDPQTPDFNIQTTNPDYTIITFGKRTLLILNNPDAKIPDIMKKLMPSRLPQNTWTVGRRTFYLFDNAIDLGTVTVNLARISYSPNLATISGVDPSGNAYCWSNNSISQCSSNPQQIASNTQDTLSTIHGVLLLGINNTLSAQGNNGTNGQDYLCLNQNGATNGITPASLQDIQLNAGETMSEFIKSYNNDNDMIMLKTSLGKILACGLNLVSQTAGTTLINLTHTYTLSVAATANSTYFVTYDPHTHQNYLYGIGDLSSVPSAPDFAAYQNPHLVLASPM